MRMMLSGLLALVVCLVPTTPASADFGEPTRITPEAVYAQASDQATDRQGDTAYFYGSEGEFRLRIRRAGGRLGPVRTVAPVHHTWSRAEVAVDDDGDGIVVWDQRPDDFEQSEHILARRFTRTGELGPEMRITPQAHFRLADLEVASLPGGKAIVTWNRIDGSRYLPYMRTVSLSGDRGPVRKLGAGPDASAPLVAVERSGRATLMWTNGHLLARHLLRDGSLSPLRRIRRQAHAGESLGLTGLGIDRRGVAVASCTRWTKNTQTFPGQPGNSRELACWLRASPRLRLLGKVGTMAPKRHTIGTTFVGVAPSGTAVVGWVRNYVNGAWVRRIRPDGAIGTATQVSDGGLGEIVLTGDGDGVIASVGIARDGRFRQIRATTVSNGRFGRTRVVGRNDYDTSYLRAGLTPKGRILVSWNEELDNAGIVVVSGR